jgi:hypothetical protein
MNKDLQEILKCCTDVAFRELQHALSIASHAKDFCRNNKISVEDLADGIEMSIIEAQSFCDGTHLYDIRSIAKYEAFVQMTLAKKDSVVIKIKGEKI